MTYYYVWLLWSPVIHLGVVLLRGGAQPRHPRVLHRQQTRSNQRGSPQRATRADVSNTALTQGSVLMHPNIPGLPGFQLNPRTIGGLAAAAVPVNSSSAPVARPKKMKLEIADDAMREVLR
ncbi:hypothetical protein [Stutzerimonas stutzeri]|uniref:hypothetical protein n=1 Tax=Stutzerimonas stutzeri TaxID=316 RepID=UPI002108F203|nr:hypothetical protein [Stutzerimonas stutzeri]MCQ4318745.1 hypothetical protein [Stutzerimonas stutzeri]